MSIEGLPRGAFIFFLREIWTEPENHRNAHKIGTKKRKLATKQNLDNDVALIS